MDIREKGVTRFQMVSKGKEKRWDILDHVELNVHRDRRGHGPCGGGAGPVDTSWSRRERVETRCVFSNTGTMVSEETSQALQRLALASSNLAALFPIFFLLRFQHCWQWVVEIIFVTLSMTFSILMHLCDVSDDIGLTTARVCVADLDLLLHLDFIFALQALPVAVMFGEDALHPLWKPLGYLVSLVANSTILKLFNDTGGNSGVEDRNIAYAWFVTIFTIIAISIRFMYGFTQPRAWWERYYADYVDLWDAVAGTIFGIVAFVFKQLGNDSKQYWLWHSLWHIFSYTALYFYFSVYDTEFSWFCIRRRKRPPAPLYVHDKRRLIVTEAQIKAARLTDCDTPYEQGLGRHYIWESERVWEWSKPCAWITNGCKNLPSKYENPLLHIESPLGRRHKLAAYHRESSIHVRRQRGKREVPDRITGEVYKSCCHETHSAKLLSVHHLAQRFTPSKSRGERWYAEPPPSYHEAIGLRRRRHAEEEEEGDGSDHDVRTHPPTNRYTTYKSL